MKTRSAWVAAAVAGFVGANLLPYPLFETLLKTLLPGVIPRLAPPLPGEADAALAGFRLSLGLTCAALPLSAILTEIETAVPRYLQACLKSLVVALLLAGLGVFYQNQNLASAARVAARLPATYPKGPPAITINATPLPAVFHFTWIGLLLFGPIDIYIARFQKTAHAKSTPLPAA